jgi:alpha-beta hydrolase superfamily lysophospholipase
MALAGNRSSWLTGLWTTLAAASGVGYIATAYTVSRWLTRTHPAISPHPPPDPATTCEELECRTADGLRLAGWVVSPPRPRGTLVLFHGLRGHRGRLVSRILFLAAAGFRCVAFDLRGHGQSDGNHTSFGYFERYDVATILDLVQSRWPDQPHAVLGISMGAAAVCYAADRVQSCCAIILESLYHDLASAFQTRVGTAFPAWFGRFARGVVWLTERRLGVRLERLAPVGHMAELSAMPVLFLTGSDDPHASPDDVRDLFDHCPEPREFAVIPGARHDNVCEVGGQTYRDIILNFLQRHWDTRRKAE